MHRQYNEDLFETTKMTFGEHLEELRRSLIKATLALVIGFGIGLIFGGDLVRYVQTPLKAALKDYYTRVAKGRVSPIVGASSAAKACRAGGFGRGCGELYAKRGTGHGADN